MTTLGNYKTPKIIKAADNRSCQIAFVVIVFLVGTVELIHFMH